MEEIIDKIDKKLDEAPRAKINKNVFYKWTKQIEVGYKQLKRFIVASDMEKDMKDSFIDQIDDDIDALDDLFGDIEIEIDEVNSGNI